MGPQLGTQLGTQRIRGNVHSKREEGEGAEEGNRRQREEGQRGFVQASSLRCLPPICPSARLDSPREVISQCPEA